MKTVKESLEEFVLFEDVDAWRTFIALEFATRVSAGSATEAEMEYMSKVLSMEFDHKGLKDLMSALVELTFPSCGGEDGAL